MKIFRNKKNQKLYLIEDLIIDMRFANRNAFAGIYARPYKHNGQIIHFNSQSKNEKMNFVNENFEIVSEL